MMAGRTLCLVSLLQGLVVLIQPPAARAGEKDAQEWDRKKAGQFLDQRGENWFKFGGAQRGEGQSSSTCVSCHSLLPYALARPVLRRLTNEGSATEWETKILEQAKRRVANWDRLDEPAFRLYYDFDNDKKKQSRGTESVLNALILSLDDRLRGLDHASADAKKAFTILWATQIKEGKQKGSWEWLNFGMGPWESNTSPYMGATLAAIAIGAARGSSAAGAIGESSQQGLALLRGYLTEHYSAQNLHNRIFVLWASAYLDGLLTSNQKEQLIRQILEKQQSSGGWSLASLGDFAQGTLKDAVSRPDGYATGLILHALQLGGLSQENPQVSKGIAWLRANQDATGAWRAMSMNKKREPESTNPAKANIGKFMWDAATGYAVLALSH
jgi:squalene-hopene/tetraprenyl-beta-curcumene cyclase